MKTALIVTLGNRDIQINEEKFALLPDTVKPLFKKNNDADKFFVINKEHELCSFFDISQILFKHHLSTISPYLEFPLIQSAFDEITKQVNSDDIQLYLFATHQNDKQDCYYVAKIIQQCWKKSNTPEIVEITINPTKISELSAYLFTKFQEIKNNSNKVFVENAGGTPQMRTATHFAGLFQGFIFYNINARTGKTEQESYEVLERLILKQIVEKMLDVYDYEGIRNLPLRQEIKDHCTRALEQYNLVNSIGQGNYQSRSLQAINLLIENIKVCYRQGRYAETIGRMFRIEEAVWYVLFYKFLYEKNLLDDNENIKWKTSDGKSKKQKFHQLIESVNAMESFLKAKFPDTFTPKNGTLYFTQHSDISIRSGKNFYYYFFKSENVFSSFTDFFEKINKDDSGNVYSSNSILNKMRNKSYLGHGFQGISETDIKNAVGDIYKFLDSLKELLIEEFGEEFNRECKSIFEDTNQKIRSLLE